jgi:phosphoserine aminotransferase
MKPRGFYFGAGPAMLPDEILLQAQQDLMNWKNTGLSILEIGHRSSDFMDMLAETESLIREILNIPHEYAVLFLGGSARLQFGAIPENFLLKDKKAAFMVTGTWSQLAFEESKKLYPEQSYCIANSESQGFCDIPEQFAEIQDQTQYLYFCPNETIHGVRFTPPDEYKHLPWIADMTSCLFSEPIEIRRYGLIFAGAQKNIANAGMTLVIVRKDWLEQSPQSIVPTMMDLRTHAVHHSLYATPPTFNCYMAYLMMKWIIKQGGVKTLAQINQTKAEMLYDFIDHSLDYHARVAPRARSLMNVCFSTGDKKRDADLLMNANLSCLYGLKGHRVLGGLRASLYNAMPLQGVEALLDFLKNTSTNLDQSGAHGASL